MFSESFFRSFYTSIIDLIFPNACVLCKVLLPQQQILCCNCLLANAKLSSKKIGANQQIEVFSMFNYREPIDKLIHSKFNQDVRTLKSLGRLLWQCPGLQATVAESGIASWVIVPVPLHWKRFWSRGFNQAEFLATALSQQSGYPTVSILQRTKNTLPQMQTRNKTERQHNLNGAITLDTRLFFGNSPTQLKNRYKDAGVILVDDLLTSGATLLSCAEACKSLKFGKIIAVTVCRG